MPDVSDVGSPLRDKPDKPAESLPNNPWPLLVCLALACVGLGYAVTAHWRRASVMMSAAMVAAGMFRLLLSRELAGLLVVRRRWFDVTAYLGLGAAIVLVAFLVPPAR